MRRRGIGPRAIRIRATTHSRRRRRPSVVRLIPASLGRPLAASIQRQPPLRAPPVAPHRPLLMGCHATV
eukprot:6799350-Prymnesium_polylepis.1